MIRAMVDSRLYLSVILSLGIGITLNQRIPFPSGNAVLQLILLEKPMIFYGTGILIATFPRSPASNQ